MFEVVTPAKRRRAERRPLNLLTSVGLHALAVLGLAQIPLQDPSLPLPRPEEVVRYFEVPALPPPPGTAAPEPPSRGDEAVAARSAPAPAPAAVAPLIPPREIPSQLPSPGLETATPVFSLAMADSVVDLITSVVGDGTGGSGSGSGSAAQAEDTEEPILYGALERARRPRLINQWELEGLWRKLYPRHLLRARQKGEARVMFVIDQDGRVDPASIRILSATHEDFGVATMVAASRLRFRPARLGGQPVRVRAFLPVSWRPYDM